ncbi:MAG: selenium cofactor biosynthesis protein YqeC [Chromatiales bacterium]|jgi:probable selenium-dependent hydroxylase accessory protein YqeC|nr:selenium cofactor biosynthesis protein YqeC [Chromatiales bacterium]
MDLLDLFEARSGLICAVGAGGKKTTLYALARRHPGRIALTASVYTTFFPDDLGAVSVIADETCLAESVAAHSGASRLAYACPGSKPGRHAGVSPDRIRQIHNASGFDATFVKADGARMRWVKAPRPDEPRLPSPPCTVLAIASARALGEPLGDRIAHRADRVAAVTRASSGEIFEPRHLARLLSSDDGLLQGTSGHTVVPVINMVDDQQRLELARTAGKLALESTDRFDRVILARMRDESNPVMEVVFR